MKKMKKAARSWAALALVLALLSAFAPAVLAGGAAYTAVPAPTILVQPLGAAAKKGAAVTLTVSAKGTGTLAYQWYRTTVNDISTIRGDVTARSSSYTVPEEPGTVYYCVGVTDTVDGVTSAMTYSNLVAVTYPAAAAPVITAQPEDLSLLTGDKAIFDVHATGEGLHYQWYYVDAGTPQKTGTDSDELVITDLRPEKHNGYDYYCVVTNADGSVTSAKAHLTVSDASYTFPFRDVPKSAWYYGDVKSAHQMGLVNGKTAAAFCPNDPMTYAEAIKLAACMNQQYSDGTVTLKNGTGKWYSTYVSYAASRGIPTDFPDYGAKVTRRDYVRIFYYALPSDEYGKLNLYGSIPDVARTDGAWKEIHAFYEAGILTGYADGSFRPDSTITRAEVSAVLTRMMDDTKRISASE